MPQDIFALPKSNTFEVLASPLGAAGLERFNGRAIRKAHAGFRMALARQLCPGAAMALMSLPDIFGSRVLAHDGAARRLLTAVRMHSMVRAALGKNVSGIVLVRGRPMNELDLFVFADRLAAG